MAEMKSFEIFPFCICCALALVCQARRLLGTGVLPGHVLGAEDSAFSDDASSHHWEYHMHCINSGENAFFAHLFSIVLDQMLQISNRIVMLKAAFVQCMQSLHPSCGLCWRRARRNVLPSGGATGAGH